MDKILKCDHFSGCYRAALSCVLFIMLYKVVLAFASVDEILKCDHSNQYYKVLLSSFVLVFGIRNFRNIFR